MREELAVDDLGLGYLHSSLKSEGIKSVVIDSIHDRIGMEQLESRLLELKPKYIGYSDTFVNFSASLNSSQRIKEAIPGVNIIYGDMHASLYRKEIMTDNPHVDFIICGEGERSLVQLIRAIENGTTLEKVPGLTWRKKGEIRKNAPDFIYNLDSLPFPYRSSLNDKIPIDRRLFNLTSSRGCPGRCTYCTISIFRSRYVSRNMPLWRSRSPENVFSEILYLYDKGARHFMIFDDNWLGNRETSLPNALRLAELIQQSSIKITFGDTLRPDSLLASDQVAECRQR